MPQTARPTKIESFNFRIEPELKAAFCAAAAAEDKPAGQVLREFMRGYVSRQRDRAEVVEARRQSMAVARLADNPDSDENAVMHWIEAVSDTEGWKP